MHTTGVGRQAVLVRITELKRHPTSSKEVAALLVTSVFMQIIKFFATACLVIRVQ
ncbi:hypothetical protein BV20DRAFT_970581 [Pilatotrama ljubarskyi]|nr:hypothetical protein BV20DRAFT_970581 [Pilatotrama ljubarskyi]